MSARRARNFREEFDLVVDCLNSELLKLIKEPIYRAHCLRVLREHYYQWVGEPLPINVKRYSDFLVGVNEPEEYFLGLNTGELLVARHKAVSGSALAFQIDSLVTNRNILDDEEAMAVFMGFPLNALDLFPKGATLADLTRRDNQALHYMHHS